MAEEEAGKRGIGFSLLRIAEQTGGEVRTKWFYAKPETQT